MSTRNNTILCFGEILWDIFHDDLKGKSKAVLGGAPSNLCYFFNTLSESAQLISQVGNDDLGLRALQKIEVLKIPHFIATSNTLPTGKVDITIIDHEPNYLFNTPAAWDTIPYPTNLIAQETMENVQMIAFGSLASRLYLELGTQSSFNTLTQILHNHPKALRFLDLNLRPPFYNQEMVYELLNFADILKINETEFHYLKECFSLSTLSTRDALYALIIQLRLNYVILTLGENGSIVMSENNYSALSAKKINNPNTVGAGDGFSAGFITALNRGASFAKAHHFANELSAYICTQEGAFIDIPHTFIKALNAFEKW